MKKSPGLKKNRPILADPDAETLDEFLAQAKRVWKQQHPEQRGFGVWYCNTTFVDTTVNSPVSGKGMLMTPEQAHLLTLNESSADGVHVSRNGRFSQFLG